MPRITIMDRGDQARLNQDPQQATDLQINETITSTDVFADGIAPVYGDTITNTDTTGLSDSLVPADIITSSDLPALNPALVPSDSSTLSDGSILNPGLAPSDSSTLTEGSSLSDGLAPSDSLTSTDSPASTYGLVPSDTSALSDTNVLNPGLVPADSLTSSDSKIFTIGQGPSDSLVSSDSPANSLSRPFADSSPLVDASSILEQLSGISDSITTSDQQSQQSQLVPSDSITSSDATNKGIAPLFGDSIALTDVELTSFILSFELDDVLGVTDAFNASVGLDIISGNFITLSDSADSTTDFNRATNDSSLLSDLGILNANVEPTDTITPVDNLLSFDIHSAINEILLAIDDPYKETLRNSSDLLSVDDNIFNSIDILTDETLVVTDHFAFGNLLKLLLSDVLLAESSLLPYTFITNRQRIGISGSSLKSRISDHAQLRNGDGKSRLKS